MQSSPLPAPPDAKRKYLPMNSKPGSRASRGMMKVLDFLQIAQISIMTFSRMKGMNRRPKKVKYHALAGFTSMET